MNALELYILDPSAFDGQTFSATLVVSDGELTDSCSFTIIVSQTSFDNTAPTFTSCPDITCTENVAQDETMNIADSEGTASITGVKNSIGMILSYITFSDSTLSITCPQSLSGSSETVVVTI